MEALGIEVSIKDGILKMVKASMVVLKGVQRNNPYYLKGNMVTGKVTISINLDNDYTILWRMRLGHTGEKFLQALVKKSLL